MAKFCANCGNKLEDNEKFCNKCGEPAGGNTVIDENINNGKQKKKKGKKLLYIIIAVIVLFAGCTAMFSSGDESSSSVSENTLENTSENIEQSTSESETEEESDTYTAYDLYKDLSEYEDLYYTLNTKASTFLKEHGDLFTVTNRSDIPEELIDYSIEYKHIAKNDTKYGDMLMSLDNLTVVQVFEESIGNGEYLTSLNVIDMLGQQYWIYYKGELENVYEDEIINVVGLPLGNSSFSNVENGDTLVLVIAGSYIEISQL